jgi:hypothetical protein
MKNAEKRFHRHASVDGSAYECDKDIGFRKEHKLEIKKTEKQAKKKK